MTADGAKLPVLQAWRSGKCCPIAVIRQQQFSAFEMASA